MKAEESSSLRPRNNFLFVSLIAALLLSSIPIHTSDSSIPSSLRRLIVDGHFTFQNVLHTARDFGNRYQYIPSAVLYPKSVSDIAVAVKHVYEMGMFSKLTVAARGHGHSLQGQAQAADGVVIVMESLKLDTIVHRGGRGGGEPYVEVSGGALWIDILKETLKVGLAPKSWTDYLHLTVGGTLSNAGVSGQAFRHGPQISNVHQLEVVTGKGEVMNCSSEQNADLFFSVLGGLGQFGIITRARIALEPAPKMVRWIRVLYSNFDIFAADQEKLISWNQTFDYIEGFVIKNRTGILNNWRSFLNPQDPLKASQFRSEGRVLYCLELTKNFNPNETDVMNKEVSSMLSKLRYIPSTLFQSEVSYVDFLDRVHGAEKKLRSKGLWDVPHPWLNLLIPRSRISEFSTEVFRNIVSDSNSGPIIIYPVNKSKWDSRTSAVTPEGDDDIFYLVAFLTSVPSMSDHEGLQSSLKQNQDVLNFCKKAGIPMKQYLPHYTTVEDWKDHFGDKWNKFVQRKSAYDPLAILAPGQRIFQKGASASTHPAL